MYTTFMEGDRGPQKPTMDSEKMIPRKMDTSFEISTLEKPRVPNFIKIGQLLVFSHFLGDPPEKNISFLD